MGTTFIYVLNDPRTNQIRYVGKADDPLERWKAHCKPDKKNPHKTRWVLELLRLGLLPELEILEEVPKNQWQEIEREYIRVFRMIGIPLTNVSEGGEGVTMTPEVREKIGRANKKHTYPSGKNHPNFGKHWPKEARQNMSLAHKGRPGPMEGKKHTEVSKEKMRLSQTGKTHSLETRQKMKGPRGPQKNPSGPRGKQKNPRKKTKDIICAR